MVEDRTGKYIPSLFCSGAYTRAGSHDPDSHQGSGSKQGNNSSDRDPQHRKVSAKLQPCPQVGYELGKTVYEFPLPSGVVPMRLPLLAVLKDVYGGQSRCSGDGGSSSEEDSILFECVCVGG